MKLTQLWVSFLALFVSFAAHSPVGAETVRDAVDQQAKAIEAKMIAWRRDIHQHPELGNREADFDENQPPWRRRRPWRLGARPLASPAAALAPRGAMPPRRQPRQ